LRWIASSSTHRLKYQTSRRERSIKDYERPMITNAYPSVILEDEDYGSKASINGRRCTPMLDGPG
jgi:hypothetical protein